MAYTTATVCNAISDGSTDISKMFKVCARNEGSDVVASIGFSGYMTLDYGVKIYWEMFLQRKSGSTWVTAGTRRGYLATGSPSNRTFTGVNVTGAGMRLRVRYYQDAGYTNLGGTSYSPTFYR